MFKSEELLVYFRSWLYHNFLYKIIFAFFFLIAHRFRTKKDVILFYIKSVINLRVTIQTFFFFFSESLSPISCQYMLNNFIYKEPYIFNVITLGFKGRGVGGLALDIERYLWGKGGGLSVDIDIIFVLTNFTFFANVFFNIKIVYEFFLILLSIFVKMRSYIIKIIK